MNLRELFDKLISTDINEIGITVREEGTATIKIGNTTLEVKLDDQQDRFRISVEET